MPRTTSPKSSKPTTPRAKRPKTNDVPVLEINEPADESPTADETTEPTDDTSTSLLGYDSADFDLSDDDLTDAAETSRDDTVTPSASSADTTKHPRQRTVNAQRTVMSKGSEKADRQYAIKRLREAVWYRLRHTLGYSIAQSSKKLDGFKLDTMFDDAIVRVTYKICSTPVDKMSEKAYADAQDLIARTVDEYDAQLSSLGFTTEHASFDGVPYVSIALSDNPVSQPES